jgi:hypothetical protein
MNSASPIICGVIMEAEMEERDFAVRGSSFV